MNEIEHEELKLHMITIFKDIEKCCSKIISSSKFIDYFVHDILDYSFLNKDDKHFGKNMGIFDFRHAINELRDIQADKI